MRAIVKADIRTGHVYSVPFPTIRDARRYCTKAHRPWRGVLLAGPLVECYQEGTLVSTERV